MPAQGPSIRASPASDEVPAARKHPDAGQQQTILRQLSGISPATILNNAKREQFFSAGIVCRNVQQCGAVARRHKMQHNGHAEKYLCEHPTPIGKAPEPAMTPDDAKPPLFAPNTSQNTARARGRNVGKGTGKGAGKTRGGNTKQTLESRYELNRGHVFLNGTQALVRLMLDQARLDKARGLSTGGLVTGYRGSPMAEVDVEMWRAKRHTDAHGVEFLPAINEDMAASILAGAQQAEGQPHTNVDGVFGLWYGKGPGLDRSLDALNHANAYGSSPNGGVLLAVGDDHGCVSSTLAHQSEFDLIGGHMPVISPSDISEIISFGLFGFALSRFSGLWVGFKCAAELIEAAGSIELAALPSFRKPRITDTADGFHIRWPDFPGLHLEERMQAKVDAASAFARMNRIDKLIHGTPRARIGFVSTGKAHGDLMESLRLLGLDARACKRLGIDIYKLGMTWPVERDGAMDFMRGKHEIIFVEEKRGLVEEQFRAISTMMGDGAPARFSGKTGPDGKRLIKETGVLSATYLLPVVAARLDHHCKGEDFAGRARALTREPGQRNAPPFAQRTPHFCSGCPHNTSTRVPEGSQALSGIGCHFMAVLMDRQTKYICQMGGEGAGWTGTSKFNGNRHIFQNLGDGTWYHSGSLAIRQAVAANTNITFKVLFNDAVAMTGGQPVDGPISPQMIAMSAAVEGVRRIAIVSDDPRGMDRSGYPDSASFHDRREMDALQRELRLFEGVSLLLYNQTCAAEKRRRRKRGLMDDPKRFVVINQEVCEGCGDCSIASNCLSVEPVDTPLGRKRRINNASCNKDYTCLDGFCPSFVTVEGERITAARRKVPDSITRAIAKLEAPALPAVDERANILVTGVGGTGVTTVGAVLAMAAHLDGTAVSLLNFSGLAQKFGAVMSFLRLAANPDELHQARIADGAADTLIGCDAVVSASPPAMVTYRRGMKAVLNIAEMTTGEIVGNRDLDLQIDNRIAAIASATGSAELEGFDANHVAQTLFGDVVYANMMMAGAAWQTGAVPVSRASIMRAIELNDVKTAENKLAFDIGRLMPGRPELVIEAVAPASGEAMERRAAPTRYEDIVEHRAGLLAAYQNAAYARRYRGHLEAFAARCDDRALRRTVATQLYRVMAYKDEYEVARLHADTAFRASLDGQFAGGYRTANHMVVPFLTRATDSRGRPRKSQMRLVKHLFPLLASMKWLRGGWLDPFAYQKDRRAERRLMAWYIGLMDAFNPRQDIAKWRKVLGAVGEVRGFGPVKLEAAERVMAEVNAQLSRASKRK